MEAFHQLLAISSLLLCIVVARGSSNGSSSSPTAQVYWHSHFPNTPIPSPLLQLLPADARIRRDFLQGSLAAQGPLEKGKRIGYGVGYWSEAKTFSKNQTFNASTVYFRRDNLRPYESMNIMFTKSLEGVDFLPRKTANSIPFSSSKLAEILNYTSINPLSKEAQVVKQTLQECEAPAIKGEDKYCATSFESLADNIVSKIGQRVQTLYNEVEKDQENKRQIYRIQNVIKTMGGNDKNRVCHKERYAYAVYYCHNIKQTEVYQVPMRGEDGSMAKAVVVCHLDTSDWNPKHFAFQVLNLKPGGPPVCHFLNSDTVVFLPN